MPMPDIVRSPVITFDSISNIAQADRAMQDNRQSGKENNSNGSNIKR
jgi:hypothetical protein